MPYGFYDDRTIKRMVIDAMEAGLPWDEAIRRANAPISRATAFRWRDRFLRDGEAVFDDHRHGHPWKLDQPVQDWIVAYCQAHPHTPSHALIPLLQAHFDITVSVARLNRVRAHLGVTYQHPRREKKAP